MQVIVNNDSNQPVYNVNLTSGAYAGGGQPFLQGDEFAVSIGTLPPGRYTAYVPYPGVGMGIRIEAAMSFTDIRGKSWIRDAVGGLTKTTDPYEAFDIGLPPSNWVPLIKINE